MENKKKELNVFNEVITSLSEVDADAQIRILQMVTTFLKIEAAPPAKTENKIMQSDAGVNFSDREERSPKQFLNDKNPKTDIDRIACLAYYLTHYRNMPHFKTLELSKLNTEAAQPKFSNAAFSTTNATNKGLLVPAGKGNKQISAVGEQYVNALPDLVVARGVLERAKRRNKTIKKKKSEKIVSE